MCIVVGIVVFLATMIFGGKLWHNERMIVFYDGKDTLTLLLAAVIPLAGWFIFQDTVSSKVLYSIVGLFLLLSLLLTLLQNISAGNGVWIALFAVWFKACLFASVVLVLIFLLIRFGGKK